MQNFDVSKFDPADRQQAQELLRLTKVHEIEFLVAKDGKPWFIGWKLAAAKQEDKAAFRKYLNSVEAKFKGDRAWLLQGDHLTQFKERWQEQHGYQLSSKVSQLWVCEWKCAFHYLISKNTSSSKNGKVAAAAVKERNGDIVLSLTDINQFLLQTEALIGSLSGLREMWQRIKDEQESKLPIEEKPDLLEVEDIQEVEPEEPPVEEDSLTKDALLNLMIRRYTIENGLGFDAVWNKVYLEFKREHRIDLKRRTANHRPKLSTCQYAKQYGFLDRLYETAKRVLFSN